ncbi:MAG: hypothetical protein WA738_13770 [Candidatus Angelobacter sp.]
MPQKRGSSPKKSKDSYANKKAAHGAALIKEAKLEGNLSGKAMQDDVLAYAKTHELKKSQSLEED